ncbi:MAG: MBL fold metallo-hydrolase [Actinomycetota bacterium]|nr:MBL fold metallo-hydrolase [Actinomycetota bacterium]
MTAENAGRPVSGPITDYATLLLAPNPSPMTLDGTNTWILGLPGASAVAVVDPGPRLDAHLSAVTAHVADAGARVELILLTHGHADHSEGAADFAERTGAPVLALDPAHRIGGGQGLHDGDVLRAGELEIRVVGTPGHTSDSLSFLLPDGAMLTGDTVLGRGTAVVAHPDGSLADYLHSLRMLRELLERNAAAGTQPVILPGHGPVVRDALRRVDEYLHHRAQRLEQVRAACEAGARTAADVVRTVYADLDPALFGAAELSVRAQLEYLGRPVG